MERPRTLPSFDGPRSVRRPAQNASAQPAKRSKLQDARHIRTQPPSAVLEDGRLDLAKFLDSRKVEIDALETSMQKCTSANNTRAFQQVPRAMRRRTASHNPKRVPRRLRDRARHEQLSSNAPTVEARKRRPKTTRAHLRREMAKICDSQGDSHRHATMTESGQEDDPNTCDAQGEGLEANNSVGDYMINKMQKHAGPRLPTHLWHKKRAFIPAKPYWGFSIPQTPTEKCYRATHRASTQQGAVVWDMTYMSTIGLEGVDDHIKRLLEECVPEVGSFGQQWRAGKRHETFRIHKKVNGSWRFVCPATMIWNPDFRRSAQPEKPRKVFIRIHPSCFEEVHDYLLAVIREKSLPLHIEDLRFEVGSIELAGSGSTEALLGVLQPYDDKDGTEDANVRIFKSFNAFTEPSVLHTGALLAFGIKDPRLAYPPKNILASKLNTATAVMDTLANWAVEQGDPKPIALFDKDCRMRASLHPKSVLDPRKSNDIAGQALPATPHDRPIPIMLLASSGAVTYGNSQAMRPGVWTLLAPWDCVLSIWYSLVHYPLSGGNNPRFGGLDEYRQVLAEQQSPWFPGDFPTTDAGWAWELQQRQHRGHVWSTLPRGKRVAFESVRLGAARQGEEGSGHACDWEYLIDLQGFERRVLPKDQPPIDLMNADDFNSKLQLKIRPPATSTIIASIRLVGRGVVRECARVYRLPDSTSPLREQWLQQKETKKPWSSAQKASNASGQTRRGLILKSLLETERPYPKPAANVEDIGAHPICPNSTELMGFVTTGQFNLSQGRPTAIASLMAIKALEALWNNPLSDEGKYCIVRNVGESVGWLARWEAYISG
ncbi:ribonucleases P/MRP protein subunit POP1-domain-containing protein [Diplogelasinospora grovesii]|uniref:Ribonucleases P/MRP protein subunit POP1-domain-containing protein n=1 Tax=Diplogelasinospora grovesii TaxID=303347 RepID=A0AAN6S7A9_9PEZI|nr:ribonucleases P/MRP protein subunit POP1-domain-containing protein [Diplogelasinospora grovesii]